MSTIEASDLKLIYENGTEIDGDIYMDHYVINWPEEDRRVVINSGRLLELFAFGSDTMVSYCFGEEVPAPLYNAIRLQQVRAELLTDAE